MDSKLASLKANVELSDLLVVCGLSLAGALVWDHKYNDGRFWREIKSSFKPAPILEDGEKSETTDAVSVISSAGAPNNVEDTNKDYTGDANVGDDKKMAVDQGFPKWGDFSKLGGENSKRGEKGTILKFWAVIFFLFSLLFY